MIDDNSMQLVSVSCPDYSHALVAGLWQSFLEKTKTDLTLRCHERSIRVHRLIANIFLGPTSITEKTECANKWTNDDHNYVIASETNAEIVTQTCSHDHLSALVEFMYRGTVNVPQKYLKPLAKVANELGFRMLVDSVETTIEAVSEQNCLQTKANPIPVPPKHVDATKNGTSAIVPPSRHRPMIYRMVPKSIYRCQQTNSSPGKNIRDQPAPESLTTSKTKNTEPVAVTSVNEIDQDESVIVPLSPSETINIVETVVETSSVPTKVNPAISDVPLAKSVSVSSFRPTKTSQTFNITSIAQANLKAPAISRPNHKEYVRVQGNTGSVQTETGGPVRVSPAIKSIVQAKYFARAVPVSAAPPVNKQNESANVQLSPSEIYLVGTVDNSSAQTEVNRAVSYLTLNKSVANSNICQTNTNQTSNGLSIVQARLKPPVTYPPNNENVRVQGSTASAPTKTNTAGTVRVSSNTKNESISNTCTTCTKLLLNNSTSIDEQQNTKNESISNTRTTKLLLNNSTSIVDSPNSENESISNIRTTKLLQNNSTSIGEQQNTKNESISNTRTTKLLLNNSTSIGDSPNSKNESISNIRTNKLLQNNSTSIGDSPNTKNESISNIRTNKLLLNNSTSIGEQQNTKNKSISNIRTNELLLNNSTSIGEEPIGHGTKLKICPLHDASKLFPVYRCRHCKFHTLTPEILKKHEWKHDPASDAEKFPCKFCGIVFVVQTYLKRHVCNEGQCPYCPFKCATSQHLYQKHLARHGPDGTDCLCDLCPKTFPDQEQLALHKANHRLHQCSQCEFSTYVRKKWREHLKETHSIKFRSMSICLKPDCSSTFAKHNEMLRHIKLAHPNEKLFVCSQCDKPHRTRSNMYYHIKIAHTDESKVKTEVCSVCGFRAQYVGALKRHMDSHISVRLFACQICEKHFKGDYDLKKHLRRHKMNGAKPYVCNICSRAYETSYQLKIHMKRHSGEKDYRCDVCDKTFYSRYQLTRHLQTHQRQRKGPGAKSEGGSAPKRKSNNSQVSVAKSTETKRKSKRSHSQVDQGQGSSQRTKSEGRSETKRKSKLSHSQVDQGQGSSRRAKLEGPSETKRKSRRLAIRFRKV